MLYINGSQQTINTTVTTIDTNVSTLNTNLGSPTTPVSDTLSIVDTNVDTLLTNVATIDTVVDNIYTDTQNLLGGAYLRKTLEFANTTGTQALFTITGTVKIQLFAVCKTNLESAGGCNIKLTTTSAFEFIAYTDCTTLEAGEVWNDTTSTTKIERFYDAVFEYVIGDGADVQLELSAQVDSGLMDFYLKVEKLSADAAAVVA